MRYYNKEKMIVIKKIQDLVQSLNETVHDFSKKRIQDE